MDDKKLEQLRARREQQRKKMDDEIKSQEALEIIKELKRENETLRMQNDVLMLALTDLYEQILLK